MKIENCTLVVSSCDKYKSAWMPYFTLLKKYWPEHPSDIYLITETKQYHDNELDIKVFNMDGVPWSTRICCCLESIKTKYIIFSLEDFFLQDYVKTNAIAKCVMWMEKNEKIAVCRFYPSDSKYLEPSDKYSPFRFASSHNMRLETQFAIWNRETLISFIDKSESPHQFEYQGSNRTVDSNYKFLWYYGNQHDIKGMIFPYLNWLEDGCNIHFGKYLWNNKRLFEQNDIKGVRMHELGLISQRGLQIRLKYLYGDKLKGIGKLLKLFYTVYDKFDRLLRSILVFGLKKGIQKMVKPY